MERYERGLRAGVKITVSVTRRGYVGKRTTFVIRRGAPPLRSDRCLSSKGRVTTLPVWSLMTDRPIAAVLALIAAIVFVAAFSAAAVMRPNQAAVAENTSSRTAPAASTEEVRVARLVAPSLSRVAALPALHLPKHKPAKKKAKKAPSRRSARRSRARRSTPSTPRGRPDGDAAAAACVTPPRSNGGGVEASAKPSTPRDDPPRPARPERPSLRWMAAGLAVALLAAGGGWFVADRIAADPASPRRRSPSCSTPVPRGCGCPRAGSARRGRPRCPGSRVRRRGRPTPASATTVSVALVPADDPALVPAALVKEADGGLPRPEKARVVGLEARAYRGVRTGDAVLDVYAIPTTRGVLTIVCAARSGGPEAPTWCLNGLDQITVAGARPITPTPGPRTACGSRWS